MWSWLSLNFVTTCIRRLVRNARGDWSKVSPNSNPALRSTAPAQRPLFSARDGKSNTMSMQMIVKLRTPLNSVLHGITGWISLNSASKQILKQS